MAGNAILLAAVSVLSACQQSKSSPQCVCVCVYVAEGGGSGVGVHTCFQVAPSTPQSRLLRGTVSPSLGTDGELEHSGD